MAEEITAPPEKRFRLSLEYEPSPVDAHEWMNCSQTEATEQDRENAELDPVTLNFFRLEDLDERLKGVLAGVTSKHPSDGLSEFRKLLQSDGDGYFLFQYVLLSPKFAELMSVWALGPSCEASVPLLHLIVEIMKHPMGIQTNSPDLSTQANVKRSSVIVRVHIDKLARSIVSTKLKDIYTHLTSGERSRQRVALLLMASIVKRGSSLASEVAANFDFALNALPQLAKPYKSSQDKKQSSRGRSVRSAFVEFALSFLEVSHAALLRWILQIRPLYRGVLHKLAMDDENTILSVLKVFQARVLDPSSLVPPGLQSAIFGDATLEQLAIISSEESHSEASQVAHAILLMICTDPAHGTCPEPSLVWEISTRKSGTFGGGQGRLLRLMLKLRATENNNHRELLLSTAAGNPMLVSAYFESFPYSLEPRASISWYAAVCLISDIVLVAKAQPPFMTLATQGLPPPSFDSALCQTILGSALPQNCTRLVINRGLLHANISVRHGCVRVLMEVLSAMEFYRVSIQKSREICHQKLCLGKSKEPGQELLLGNLETLDYCVTRENMHKHAAECEKWTTLEKHLINELRSFLPDPQVLVSMVVVTKSVITSQDRSKFLPLTDTVDVPSTIDENVCEADTIQANDLAEDEEVNLMDLWNADSELVQIGDLKDIGGFLNAKLLEVLGFYQRMIPMALVDCSFDVFKLLPEDPISLLVSQQKALLMLLLTVSGEVPGSDLATTHHARSENIQPRQLYRHLKSLLKFMLKPKATCIKEQARILAYRAMSSCGAFENNVSEIGLWLEFLPLSDDAVVSFFCDAVDTIGKNIDKYVEMLLCIIQSSSDVLMTPNFGPLGICVLDKCLRVVSSNTKKFSIPQKTSIAIYVVNVLHLLLQSQVHPKTLCIILDSLLCTEKQDPLSCSSVYRSEWYPLRNLQLEVSEVLRTETLLIWDLSCFCVPAQRRCFQKALEFCKNDGRSCLEAKVSALNSSLICVYPEEIVENFPLLMELFFPLFQGKFPVLTQLFGAHTWLLSSIMQSWKDLFNKSVVLASTFANCRNINIDAVQMCQNEHDENESSSVLILDGDGIENYRFSSDIIRSFSAFLLDLPFGIIFPASVRMQKGKLLKVKPFKAILEAAISRVPPELWLSTANSILLWVDFVWKLQCQGSDVTCQLEMCFSLLKSMILSFKGQGLVNLLECSDNRNTNLDVLLEFIRGLLAHPIMDLRRQIGESLYFTYPSKIEKKERKTEYIVSGAIESWFESCRNALTLLDCNVFDILKELLQWTSEISHKKANAEIERALKLLRNAVLVYCRPFLREALDTVKKAVTDIAKASTGADISLSFATYVVMALSSYVDIESIIDVSCTLLSLGTSKNEPNDTSLSSSRAVYFDIAIDLATLGFERIRHLIQQNALLKTEVLNCSLLQKLYRKILQLAMMRPSEKIFSCLLSVLDMNYGSHFTYTDGFICQASSEYFSICIHERTAGLSHHLMTEVDTTKAKIILYLVQASQFFVAEFVKELCQYLKQLELPLGSVHTNVDSLYKEMVLILPAVNWVISIAKYQDNDSFSLPVEQIIVSYYKLITMVSEHWDIFPTSLNMTEIIPFIKSDSGFSKFFLLTTPGQLVLMIKNCLTIHSYSTEERKKLFALMFQNSGCILDLSIQNISKLTIGDTVKLVSIAIAKSMLAKMLVVPNAMNTCTLDMKAGSTSPTISDEMMERTEELDDHCCELAEMLIQALNVILKKSLECTEEKEHSVLEISGDKVELSKKHLLYILERSLLRDLKDIFRVSANLNHKAKYLSLLKRLTKMIFRCRFGERMPMQVLRFCVATMSETPGFLSPYAAYGLELLVGHSEFAQTLMFSNDTHRSCLLPQYFHEKESCARSLSSILYLIKCPLKEHSSNTCNLMENKMAYSSEMKSSDGECKKLELLKFLRLLYFLKHQGLEKVASSNVTVNSVEILSLLRAAYNASLNIVDKENLLLMQEIESLEGPGVPGISSMDYLWGKAAMKRLKTSGSSFADNDTAKEVWKRSAKDDLMLEPMKCALGVLFFPTQRKLLPSTSFLVEACDEENLQCGRGGVELLTDAAYDPCFMLPFALHSLSCGWMPPEDFVRKGFLALTLVSISSADEDMRKLGYEILSKYFIVLESCESFRGKPQVRLLLTFVKNMVTESWQRFPFIVVLFAAEASYVLMNPSDIHYPAINKFLLHAPGIDIETIPLFKPLFGSGSVHFRADRAWILRLLAFGLRTSFDTHIYRRRFVFEVMMSFYSSPLADKHTREWILQMVHRASKLRSLVQYLVEQAGLLAWLSSIATSNGTAKSGEYAVGTCDDFTLAVVQVLENALSWRSVKRWIISEGFEELAKVVWLLHCALIKNACFKEEVIFMKPYLAILKTAFNLSLARKKYQSRLSFSIKDFLGIVHFMRKHKDVVSIELQLLALEAVLESTPSACYSLEDKHHLYEVSIWAVGVVQFDYLFSPFLPGKMPMRETKRMDAAANKKSFDVDTLAERLLRWVTASLILGGLEQGFLLQNTTTAWGFLKNARTIANAQCREHIHINDSLVQMLISLHYLPGSTWRGSTSSVVSACMMLLLLGSSGKYDCFRRKCGDFLERPLSQISVPSEADTYWRWKATGSRQSLCTSEYEICSILLSFVLQFLHVEENSSIQCILERLQFAYRDLLGSRGTSIQTSRRVVRS